MIQHLQSDYFYLNIFLKEIYLENVSLDFFTNFLCFSTLLEIATLRTDAGMNGLNQALLP